MAKDPTLTLPTMPKIDIVGACLTAVAAAEGMTLGRACELSIEEEKPKNGCDTFASKDNEKYFGLFSPIFTD